METMENGMVEQLANEVIDQVTTEPQAIINSPVSEVVVAAAEKSGMPEWLKGLLLVGGGAGVGWLARMGWAKWITPRLKQWAFERKVVKAAKEAARAAQVNGMNDTAAQKPVETPTQKEPLEVDPNDVNVSID